LSKTRRTLVTLTRGNSAARVLGTRKTVNDAKANARVLGFVVMLILSMAVSWVSPDLFSSYTNNQGNMTDWL